MKLMTAALVAGLLTVGGLAQAQSMGQGYDMLTTALMSDFERMGIPTDVLDDLTLAQVAEIKDIVEADDSDNFKKGRIEAIIRDN
ncbi:hypothetical protein [Jannaschia seohaensis]|uniref:Uncharacterized protein n=1 Tax=Jannaschia seohaensis TaxID=475081 RepID=A0A2Y9B9Y3_9RHOB|nr:hypothetical protein [Jannaschia seohaensis]PWJ10068.1 hypothetical protein BCF38_12631 [Jannaschia seohaensis]SSA51837.1 hypothetical protein SAMN05421539_12631 [Jannaschia seohaensis]